MLAGSRRQAEEPIAAPKRRLAPSIIAYRIPQILSSTTALDRRPKRRQKRVRICRLYPKPESQPLIHARALLVLVQEECPQYVGGYVPRPDLEACYRELCIREGWNPCHWTAIARQLSALTSKKTVRDGGQRFVGYRIPKA